FLAVPSAFTRQTGEALWHVLNRARAIETGVFALAAAQGGSPENGRETFGHSLRVETWGRMPASGDTKPGVLLPVMAAAWVAPPPPPERSREAPSPGAIVSPQEREFRKKLKELRDHLTKNADYVGQKFPQEARKRHYGEIEHRSIYGEATPDQAKELHEEGIE